MSHDRIISMSEAMKMLGDRTTTDGETFARRYGLTLLPTTIRHGKGRATLFLEGDVLAAVERLSVTTTAIDSDKWVPRTTWLKRADDIEEKLDTILNKLEMLESLWRG